MLDEIGGLETGRKLLNSNEIPDGDITLMEMSRLDLTVESLILQEKWKDLFTDNELKIARKRRLMQR